MKSIATSKAKLNISFDGLKKSVDESKLGYNFSPKCFNFTFGDGVLRSKLGIENAYGYDGGSNAKNYYPPLDIGILIVDVFVYTRKLLGECDDRLIVQTSQEKLYYTKIFEIDTWHEMVGLSFSGKGCAVNYNYMGNDVLLLSSKNHSLIIIDGDNFQNVVNSPSFSTIETHYERAYGAVDNEERLWFSDDFNPANWIIDSQSAGYIDFSDGDGNILKLISFSNYLYIFREHGIYRLTAFGDQANFSMKKIATSTGMIFKNTISKCGERIIYLSQDGLFSFDGYTITNIAKELPKINMKDLSKGVYLNNHYYLACHTDIDELNMMFYFTNTLIDYDLENASYSMLAPIDTMSLTVCKIHKINQVLVAFNNGWQNRIGNVCELGMIFDTPTTKIYYTPKTQLGTSKLKTIREVSITTSGNITLTVILDDKEYDYILKGSDLPQTIFVDKFGYYVSFKLQSVYINNNVKSLTVSVEKER